MTTPATTAHRILGPLALAAATALTVAACGGGSSSDSSPDAGAASDNTAVIRTVASDFSSGDVELIDLEAESLNATGGYFSGKQSDLAVSTAGNNYFLLERFQADHINKVDLDNPAVVVWDYPTVDGNDDDSANPAQLVSQSEDQAYLLRANSERAWIVDPGADSEADFKTGELDLSAYIPEDNEALLHPSMVGGIIVDDRLFVVMQRLADDFSPANDAYVAVFDTTTNEEIDTGQGSGDLKGIPLATRNPNGFEYHADLGLLVHSVGERDPDNPIGGIERIDPATFARETLLDNRNVDGLAVVDDSQGYFFEYEGFGNIVLYRVDPSDGSVDGPIDDFANQDLRDVTTGPDNRIWIADADTSDPRIRILDPATDEQVESVGTDLLPASIHFAGREEDDLAAPGE